jgi:uncharacterized membrane protein
MNSLPIESAGWLEAFKNRIKLEQSILQVLIRWGLTESAFDIVRVLDSYVTEFLERRNHAGESGPFQLGEEQRTFFRTTLRDSYLKTRDIPRRRACQKRLHNALLSRFDDLSDQLATSYEAYFQRRVVPLSEERAA